MAVTPDGAIWVSDEMNGLCQVAALPGPDGNRLVRDAAGYCGPEVEVPEGAPATGPMRPSATFQIAFDGEGCQVEPATTDPSKCNFYVAEGTSASSGIWRMHWDPATGTIDDADQLYAAAGDNRVFGLALSPDGHVDFSSKRDNIIRRLSNPGTADFYLAAEAVGFSAVDGVASLAHLGQALILADGGALSRIDAPGPQGGFAVPMPGLKLGTAISAVAANPAEGIVYAGTSSGKLTDSVLAATLAAGLGDDPYDSGFANVTGLGLQPDGTLLIAHDPNAALEPGVDTAGFAELFARAPSPLNAPRVTLTATPQPAQRSGAPEDVAIDFVSRPGAQFACRLDHADVDCSSAADGTGEWLPQDAVGEGTHTFEVSAATTVEGSGPSASWVFSIDRTAPDVSIDDPTPRTAVGGSLRVHFSSDDRSASYECALDGADPAPCSPAKDLSGLAMGEHSFTVQAIDAAGNRSGVASLTFTAVPAPPAPATPSKGPAPAAVSQAGTTVRVVTGTRVPRLEIGVPCVAVSRSRARAAYRVLGARASVTFRAPAKARYAKFTLRRAAARRSGARVVETLGYAPVRAAASRLTTGLWLTRGQRRAVKAGRMGIAVAYGTCRTRVGQWEWLQTRDQEDSQR